MRMDTLEAPRLPTAHHPSTESLTLELSARWGWWEVGGEVFFFKLYLVWRVDSPCKFYLGGGGRFIFLSANGKAQDALLLFLLSLGGEKDFFSIFPCFPMCFHGVPSKFLMGSQYVPQIHNAFLNMFCI
jgi:hypothetical protein